MKSIKLECIYSSGLYPKIGLVFTNGIAVVSAEQFETIKADPHYGREFAKVGELNQPAGRVVVPEVVSISSTEPRKTRRGGRKAKSAVPEEPVPSD